jgi:hypothetical protein
MNTLSEFRSRFPRKHTFLPVIHVEGGRQALRNAEIATEEGADGIFFINHNLPYCSLIHCYEMVRKKLPKLWIGLNCLDLGGVAVSYIPKKTAGLWVDNAGIDEGPAPTIEARKFALLREESGWKGLYFGGVAFKYQKKIAEVAKVAKLAIPFVDVITTSGAGTGIAPCVEKIAAMKKAIGDHPLAIASGVTPENVSEYMPHADCFLVATGISDTHTKLNPKKVHQFVKAIGR